MDNGRALGFRGDISVKYTDVVAGGEAITMVVRISGGRRAIIEPPMLIFSNENRNYPIRDLDDNIPGVSYRTGPKGGWIKLYFHNTLKNLGRIKRIHTTVQNSFGWIIVRRTI